MNTTKHTFCRICEPACPLQAEVDQQGNVVDLKPSPDNPVGGIPCNKGINFINVHHDPDRLNWPLKRINGKNAARAEFEQIEWDDAFSEITQKVQALQAEHGPNSVAIYGGNPLAFDSRTNLVLGQLAASLGSSMFFSAGTQDCTNKFAASVAMYANVANFIPDLTHTDYLLCIGANPKVSHWTSISVPNDSGKILKDIKDRGGKVTFVNPRKIESSTDATGDTLLIKPDTDAYFLAALSNEVYKLGGFDQDNLQKYGKNIEEYLNFIADWSSDKVEDVTGIKATQIKQVAADIVAASSAACYLSTGVNQGRQGTLSFWLSEMLNFATGNLGKEGGTFKPPQLAPAQPAPVVAHEVDSPFGKIPLGASMMPGVLFADFIEQQEIRAVLCFGGNPLLSMGGEQGLAEAFAKLELLACIDISPNLTTEYADYVLPAADWLERADITGYPFLTGAQLIPHVQYTDAMTAPKFDRKEDWWIVSRLLQTLGMPSPLDDPNNQGGFQMVNMLLSGHGLSIDAIKEQPYQIALLEQPPKEQLYQTNILHEDGKIDCYPESFTAYGLYQRFETIWQELEQEPDDVLKLISMRTPQMHNSWMANSSPMRGGNLSENRLRMSPGDASKRGLVDGDQIKVSNQNGEIKCRLELRNDLRSGAVSMTHGYGHAKADKLKVASQRPGQNCNRLLPTGPDTYEPISHMSWMCGVPVNIERLA